MNNYFSISGGWAGVISDTHIPIRALQLPTKIFTFFEGASLIIHAGDIVEDKVITELEAIAPVAAVSGNMDPFCLYHKYGETKTIFIDGLKIGVIHGKGRGRTTKEKVYNNFYEKKYNGAVFGHLHQPVLEYRREFLLLNPGSPTNPRRASPSCGKLWQEKGRLKAEIMTIK